MNPLQKHIGQMKCAIQMCNERGYEEAHKIWHLHNLENIPILVHGPMIFSAPVLDQEECDDMLYYADQHKSQFKVNDDEEAAYQVEELVLRWTDTSMFAQMMRIMEERVTPLFQIMTGHTPGKVGSIQLARYTPDATAQSGWHVDEQSELSCVVSLGPERHTGGGTFLRPHGPAGATIFVPALPKGHALFFNGKFVHHRGAEVRAGERNLLVFWLMQK